MMLIELAKFVGVGAIILIAVSTLRVVVDLLRFGENRVREVREEGGGLVAKVKGELDSPQGTSTSGRGQGLHISVAKNGRLVMREKSAISKEAA